LSKAKVITKNHWDAAAILGGQLENDLATCFTKLRSSRRPNPANPALRRQGKLIRALPRSSLFCIKSIFIIEKLFAALFARVDNQCGDPVFENGLTFEQCGNRRRAPSLIGQQEKRGARSGGMKIKGIDHNAPKPSAEQRQPG